MLKHQQIIATIFATTAGMKGLAIFVILIGVAIKYWIGRRRFNRRSITGVETFRSYESMRLLRFIEWLGVLIANIFIVGGILLFLFLWITPNTKHH